MFIKEIKHKLYLKANDKLGKDCKYTTNQIFISLIYKQFLQINKEKVEFQLKTDKEQIIHKRKIVYKSVKNVWHHS